MTENTLSTATPKVWSTASEIDFLTRLSLGKGAAKKLRGYIAGMARRTDFGAIDTADVLFFARQKLALLERA
jgi:hypothetical protein